MVLPRGVTTLIDQILRFRFKLNILSTILERFRCVFRILLSRSLLRNRLDSLFLGIQEGMTRFVLDSEGLLLISQVRMGRGDLRLFRLQTGFEATLRLLEIVVQLGVLAATLERLCAVQDSTAILLVFAVCLCPTYLEIGPLDFL